tara:strand:+ start:6303 stop:8018 length:1716 start_codon:yes stop_codon:yes gene_type:complete
MAIPRDFINDILTRINIVDLIDQRVPLKKSGKNYSACCPFHGEKTPSFTVSVDKQFYHCFGCGAHGNAIDFIMEFDRLDFVDAIEELAHGLGLSVPQTQSHPSQPKPAQDLYEVVEHVSRHYQQQLRQHPSKQQAISYLKQRGLTGHIAKKFQLGLAIEAWDDVAKKFVSSQRQLVQTGLLIQKEGQQRFYDRFRHRLMFPIRDRRGRTIGFGGRVFDDTKPKYLNSPETPIFHKGQELYGLYELKQTLKDIKHILIVEGYMDVVSLAQYDVNYAVASLGTSTTADQIQLLFRHTQKIVCCYDGDNAGIEAAWRTLETALPHLKAGRSIHFMFLPDQHDPDSFIREQGRQAFEKQIEKSLSLREFMFQELQKTSNIEDGSLAKKAMGYLEKVGDPILKETLMEQLAHQLRLNNAQELKKKFKLGTTSLKQAQPLKAERQNYTARLALALLIQHPELGYQLPKQHVLNHLNTPGLKLLQKLLDYTREEQVTTGQILEGFRAYPKQRQALSQLSQWQTGLPESAVSIEFKNSLIWFNNQYLEHRFNLLNQKSNLTKLEQHQLQDLLQILQSSH